MDEDRVTGAAKRVKGSIKEAIGKLTGDTRTQAEGAAEKIEGEVQSSASEAKNTLRTAAEK